MSANAAVSFGWEVQLNNSGANVYFAVTKNMVLLSVEVDTSLMILSPPAAAGFLEVLCQASVSRGTAPKFSPSTGPAYLPVVKSSDFGGVNLVNPNNLVCNFNDGLAQDLFYSVILKGWAPLDGTASSTARHTHSKPSLTLNAGDYLVFHMDHAGVPCDGEMQVVLSYTLT